MKGQSAVLADPKRSWILFLPIPAGCLALACLAAFLRPQSPVLTAFLAAAAAGLAVVEGVLVAFSLPQKRALETRALQLQAVYDVIGKAGGSLDLREVLDAITRHTVEVTGVRGCSIKLLDPGTGRMSVRSLAGLKREVPGLAAAAAESIYEKSLRDGEPVLVEGALASDFPELDGEAESLICVPLRDEGRVVGALCVYGEKGRPLSPEMLSFLSRLGDLAVLFIENASVYEGLKRVDDAKSWFLRKAAHELASPLATIQSITHTFLEGYLGEVPALQREMVERIRFRAESLSQVVADLLVLARARAHGAGQAEEQASDLCEVLRETVTFFQAAAREKGVALVVDGLPGGAGAGGTGGDDARAGADSPARLSSACLVAAPRADLLSVVTNLVSNAVKYSLPGGRVTVSLARAGRGVALAVTDQGIGIPVAEKDRLFSEFFRASNARAFAGSGTGLGLAIVKSIVERLGGTIDVQSEEGAGTTVRVALEGSG
ncbi:MAG: GAF domain-containing sensor histidine kinase [Spirochaetes bacterium]|nr:GAF domain-containing sensor histidine kinase [Spirochaetota bacterium]